MRKKYNNILVHCLVNIGDVVLSTAAVALLRQAYPDARITMMVRPSAAEIAINNPVIDDVIIFEYKAKDRSPVKVWGLVNDIRKKKFDLCVSLDRKLRPALIAFLAGIPVRVGPDRVFDDKPSWVTKLFTDVIKTPKDFRHTHQAEIFMSIIRGFAGVQGSAAPVIGKIMPRHAAKAEELLARLPKAKYRIALCVKGTYHLKNWPLDKFCDLVTGIAAKYEASFFVIGMADDKEYADELITASTVPIANFCGETGLVDLAALLAKVDLFITIDTGALHIAATTDVPIIGFFRCVSSQRWHPLTERAVVLDNHLVACPTEGAPEACPHKYCVESISVEKAIEAVGRLLAVK